MSSATTAKRKKRPPVNSPASPYLSRKFLALLGGIFVALGGALTGTVPVDQALGSIANIVIAYVVAEGAGDVAGRWSGEGG